ncbi:hypothetical protein A2U01_0047961, partial [Trifolium medium]|nr:hypothetical protein [Trifolium medium]
NNGSFVEVHTGKTVGIDYGGFYNPHAVCWKIWIGSLSKQESNCRTKV